MKGKERKKENGIRPPFEFDYDKTFFCYHFKLCFYMILTLDQKVH